MKKRLFIKLIAVILVIVTLFSTAALTISAASIENNYTEITDISISQRNTFIETNTNVLVMINQMTPEEKSYFQKSVGELKSAKTADQVAGTIINSIFAIATDPDNVNWKDVGLDTGAKLINLAASCFGFGGISEAITGGLLDIFKDKSPSEFQLLKEYIAEQNKIIMEGIEDVRNDISDLSKDMDESFAAVVKDLEDAIEAQGAGEKVYAFTFSGEGNFDYTLFKNYIYGSSTVPSDLSSQAYYDKLSRAIANNASDKELEEHYNSLYRSLTTVGNERMPYINVMRQYIMEDEFGYSIQRYYYDWLLSNRDVLEAKGKDAEWEAILFTLDVYRTMLGAEHCVLACDNYFLSQIYLEYGANPPSDAFYKYTSPEGYVTYVKYTDITNEIDNLNNKTREKALVDQMIKDIIYIFNMENSYILESADGSLYPVNNVDEATFGQVRTGQTAYMNRLSDDVCEIFGLDPQKFTYVWTNADGEIIAENTGMLSVPTDCNTFSAILYYDGTVFYSQTFKVNIDNEFCGGDGTQENPFLISNASQFSLITLGRDGRDVYYQLTNDIDFNNQTVASLGSDSNAFEGTLDGNGYSVKNIAITSSANTGLFAKIGVNGTVKNLKLENMTVSGSQGGTHTIYAGGIAAKNEGIIENCHLANSKIIISRSTSTRGADIYTYVGGLAGQCSGSQAMIVGCTITSSRIEGTSARSGDKGNNKDNENNLYVAGITANICDNANIKNCIVEGQSIIKGVATTRDDNWDKHVCIDLFVCGAVASNSMNDHKYIQNIYVSPNVVIERLAYNPDHTNKTDNIYGSQYIAVPPTWVLTFPWTQVQYEMGTREDVSLTSANKHSNVNFAYTGEVNSEYNYNKNQVYIYDEDFLKTTEVYVENGVENKRNVLNISVDSEDGFSLDSYKILGYYGLDTLSSDKINGEEHIVTLIFSATLKKEGSENKNVILSVDIPIVVEKIKPSELVIVEKPKTQYSDIGDLITLDGGKFELHWEDDSIDTDVKPQIVSNKNITAWGTSEVEISYNGINTTYEINAACTNHNYEETIEVATCFKEGYTKHTCTKCGDWYVDNIIEESKHTIIIQNATAATCNTNGIGYTGDKYCTVCEKIVEYGTDIDVLQHSYEKIDDTHCKCGVCNAQNTIAPHTYKSVENEKYIYYVCTKCGYEPSPIPKATSSNVSHIVVGQSYGLVDRDYEITVYVKMFNNPGITGLNLRIEYDPRLDFVRAEKGDVLKSSGTFEPAHAKGVIGIVSADSYATTEDGNLLKLVFKLPKDAKVTDKYPISISYGNEFTDSNADLISLVTADGYIKAVSHLPGDINSDEVVDMLDTTLLARYMAIRNTGDSELMQSFLESQHYNFSEFYADVDLDGYVNLPDLVIMLQYLVGNNTQELTSNEFEVILNPNNGSLDVESIIVKSYDENGNFGVYPELPTPSRPGYRFEGWYTSFDALDPKTVQVKAGDRVKYNPTFLYQTMYARWSEITSYTVVFDANGGNGSMQPSVHIHDTEKELPDNELTKTGYHFAGWNTKADGSGKWYANKEQVLNLVSQGIDSITIYAQWTPNSYTIHYDANGGNGTTPSSNHVYNTYAQLTNNGFSRIGYTFVEWNTKPDGSGASYSNLENVMNLVTSDGGSLTLYAQWDTITYTIKYNLNGGSYQNGETYSVSYTVEDLPTIPDLIYPTHPMYNTFEGWYEDSIFSTPLNRATLTSSPRNLNLYAKWNLCKEYNYMSTTPDVTDTRVLIDWSNATSTDVAATRGNGVLSVANTVKELIIIGNPDLTYTNFSISLVDFAANQELVVCFDNFNFTTNVDGAIKTNGTDNGMILTIDVHGTCSINTSVAGGSIIKGFTNTLNFIGDGQITITGGTGGNGADGVTTKKCERGASGGNGSTGATTISASKIVVNENVTLIVFGGNGGKGGNGGNGWSALSVGDSQGGHAGAGGNGGDAISANSITINSGCIIATGGSGGKGGTGGKGDQYGSDDANGGNGGDGGDGGCSYNSSCIIVDNPGSSSFKPGAAGAAGNGGSGDGSDGHSGSNGSDGDAGAR